MVRVPKVISIEHLVGGESADMGSVSGPEGHALLAEIDRKLADLDSAPKLREPPLQTFDEFRGNRFWHHARPKDPACSDVGLVYVQIVHGNGRLDLNLDSLAMMAWTGDIAKLKPADGIVSVVTNKPGVLVRMDEAQVGLTPVEADRLAKKGLQPEEFFAICDAVGSVWLTHDDFYDPHTGEACQPIVRY